MHKKYKEKAHSAAFSSNIKRPKRESASAGKLLSCHGCTTTEHSRIGIGAWHQHTDASATKAKRVICQHKRLARNLRHHYPALWIREFRTLSKVRAVQTDECTALFGDRSMRMQKKKKEKKFYARAKWNFISSSSSSSSWRWSAKISKYHRGSMNEWMDASSTPVRWMSAAAKCCLDLTNAYFSSLE